MPSNIVIAASALIICFLGIRISKGIIHKNAVFTLFLLIIVLTIWSYLTVTPSYGFLTFFTYLPAIALFNLSRREKQNTLQFVTKWFSIWMALSLGIYLLTRVINITAPLGTFIIQDNDFYPPFRNYLFFIENTHFLNSLLYRFNGPFLEPGHLATVCSLLLLANKFNFKENKCLWIILSCVLLSFSLAGYVLTSLGYVLIKLKNWKYVISIAFLTSILYLFVTVFWNGGDNPVNTTVVERLEFDPKKGIVGNNRTTERTDAYFKRLNENGQLWTGIGSIEKNNKIVGAGYKIYLIRYGIISTIFIFLFYYKLIPKYANKRYAYIFLFILIASFMQRAYPHWYSWILSFTLGVGTTSSKGLYITIKRPSHKNTVRLKQ